MKTYQKSAMRWADRGGRIDDDLVIIHLTFAIYIILLALAV